MRATVLSRVTENTSRLAASRRNAWSLLAIAVVMAAAFLMALNNSDAYAAGVTPLATDGGCFSQTMVGNGGDVLQYRACIAASGNNVVADIYIDNYVGPRSDFANCRFDYQARTYDHQGNPYSPTPHVTGSCANPGHFTVPAFAGRSDRRYQGVPFFSGNPSGQGRPSPFLYGCNDHGATC